jgi:RimJ/RimL family protein N-acetyltransferase
MGEEENLLPVINIVGKKVALGPFRTDLAELATKWANDFEVAGPRGMVLRPYSQEVVEAWGEPHTEGKDAWFTLYDKATLQPIGEAGLNKLNLFHRSAELGIFIGEKEFRGRGYGTETVRLILDYGFTQLDLHTIILTVAAYNEAGIQAYTRAGFKEVGRLHEALRYRGQYHDQIIMECLSSDWKNKSKGAS